MWLGGIVAVLRRKHEIGGWLFFFFWQVAAGCAVTIAFTNWAEYGPGAWQDHFKYLAFMLVTMPRFAILATIAGIGVMLIRTCEWQWVVVMRYALIIYSMLGLASVGADLLYFPDRIGVDVATLIFPVVYTAYFYVSSRVKSVFLHRQSGARTAGVASS